MRAPFRVVIKCFNYLRRDQRQLRVRAAAGPARNLFAKFGVGAKTHARHKCDIEAFQAETEFNCRTDETSRLFSAEEERRAGTLILSPLSSDVNVSSGVAAVKISPRENRENQSAVSLF